VHDIRQLEGGGKDIDVLTSLKYEDGDKTSDSLIKNIFIDKNS